MEEEGPLALSISLVYDARMKERTVKKLKFSIPFSKKRLLAVGAGTLALGWLTFQSTAAVVAGDRSPAQALRFDSDQPHAIAKTNDLMLLDARSTDSLKLVASRAQDGLRSAPLEPALLRQLGMSADAAKTPANALQFFSLAQKVTRRDAGTQLWFMERALRADRLAEGLRHFDILLRVNLNLQPILFERLRDGLQFPMIRSAAADLFRRNPPWLTDFAVFSAPTVKNPAWLADTLAGSGKLPDNRDFESASFQLLNRLTDDHETNSLFRFYNVLPGKVDVIRTSVAFKDSNRFPMLAPVAWHMIENANFSGSAVGLDDKGSIGVDAFVASGESGVFARKLLSLGTGAYRLRIGLSNVAGRARGSIIISCLDGSGGETVKATAALGVPETIVPFSVAPECPAQLIALRIAGASNEDGGLLIRTMRLDREN